MAGLAHASAMDAPKNGTAPAYVTEVVTAYTTYCPEATEITHAGETYTVSEATTLTITNCPGGKSNCQEWIITSLSLIFTQVAPSSSPRLLPLFLSATTALLLLLLLSLLRLPARLLLPRLLLPRLLPPRHRLPARVLSLPLLPTLLPTAPPRSLLPLLLAPVLPPSPPPSLPSTAVPLLLPLLAPVSSPFSVSSPPCKRLQPEGTQQARPTLTTLKALTRQPLTIQISSIRLSLPYFLTILCGG
jgi:hypothetical protein